MNKVLGLIMVGPVALAIACTTPDEPVESEVASASTATQGIDYQGIDYQGIDYQGIDYQGIDYQGIDYQGAAYGSTTAVDGSIAGTALSVWTAGKNATWQQRFPNKLCTWDTTRTISYGCTTYDLNVSPSPLAGLTFPATFEKQDQTTFQVTVRIGSGKADLSAVIADTEHAMFALRGGATGNIVSCANPDGCRVNTNIWLYQVQLLDSASQPHDFCLAGKRATALAGSWDATGGFVPPTRAQPRFTFACTNGTIAKCTRWGYRPWATAIKTGETTPVPLADYHQACVRAATADYCANGHSFTRNGTLVDLYDYEPQQLGATGFIPRTLSLHQDATSFVWESRFDKLGATELDFLRYQGLISPESYGGLEDPTVGCPGRFELGTAPAPGEYNVPYHRAYSTWTAPTVAIDNTLFCAHSELTLGRALHPGCSHCTYGMWSTDDAACVQGGTWDQACIDRAKQCAAGDRMATHSECTIGPGLTLYDSACTIAVCSETPSCCTASGWTAGCVATANARCTGGLEDPSHGFCGTPVQNPSL
jgi:hypothetical protein